MTELGEVLEECRARLAKQRKPGHRIGEQNTKAMLIEPVLAALGWDLYDPDEVNREYRRRSSDNPVDYALLLMRTPRLFVEAKGLGENIEDPRWANQIISYAAVAGVEWVALTDGAQWHIYNAHAPVPVEQKLFRTVKVDSTGPEVLETLSLLSTENMRENRIQELWRSYFIDRQVNEVLQGLFNGSEPPSELVELVTKRAPQRRLRSEDVQSSLLRVRASFDWPQPEIAPPMTVGMPPGLSPQPPTARPALRKGVRTADGQRKSASKPKVTEAERAVGLRDLLESGRLVPGGIHAHFDGTDWPATLTGQGQITINGRSYTSLSAAGQAVKIASRGHNMSKTTLATDGWLFWRAQDQIVGDVVTLKELRRRHAAQSGH